jgi:hypothetical protein
VTDAVNILLAGAPSPGNGRLPVPQPVLLFPRPPRPGTPGPMSNVTRLLDAAAAGDPRAAADGIGDSMNYFLSKGIE